MRVISWNVKGASKKSKEVWDFLLALQPDLALLQEVGDIPAQVSDEFDYLLRSAITEDGRNQRFHTGVLAKGKIVARDFISDSEDLNRQFEFFRGNFIRCTVHLIYGDLQVVSVHSPWRVDKNRLAGVDMSTLGTENPYLLGTAILRCALNNTVTTGNWIVGGDFNCSETFDPEWQRINGENPTRIPGSAQMLRQIRTLGFTECLRKSEQEPIIPTFRHRDKTFRHQIDHLFVSKSLASTLEGCSVGDEATVFGKSLSDHLPIIAQFSESRPAEENKVTPDWHVAEVNMAATPAVVYTAAGTGAGKTTIYENKIAVAELRKAPSGYQIVPDNRIHGTWRPSTKVWEDGHKAVASYFRDRTLTEAVKALLASPALPAAVTVIWESAVTYPDAPHEYMLRERYPQPYALYQERIARAGRDEQFTFRGGTATYRYYYGDDGYKYWIIDNVLNRALRETRLKANAPGTLQSDKHIGPQPPKEENHTSLSGQVLDGIGDSQQVTRDPEVFCEKHPGTRLVCRHCEGVKGGLKTKALYGDKAAEWGRKGGKLGGHPKKHPREDLETPPAGPENRNRVE